jgi:hypothetical protein
VLEHGDKKSLDTPGGEELMKRLGGTGGLPFYAFQDGQGATIINSNAPGKDGKPGENIGHPDKPEEVDWFMAMLAKAAPAMTAEERGTIEDRLRHQKK